MPPVARRTLVSPGSIKGFMSARSSMAVPDGFVCLLNDVRLDDGTVRVRWGGTSILATISGAYTIRGVFECVQNDVPTLFWAGRTAGKTLVAKSVDGGSTWNAITPSSGTYGDTRFPSEGWAYFALVTQGGVDYLVIQNGTDPPRLYDGTTTSVVEAIDASGYKAVVSASLGAGTSFVGAGPVVNVQDEDFEGIVKPYGAGYYLEIVADPQIDGPGEYATLPLADSIVVPSDTDGLQVCLFLDAGLLGTTNSDGDPNGSTDTTDERWRDLLIEGAEATGAFFPIYDPSTTQAISVPTGKTAYLVAVPALPWAGKTIKRLRFSYPDVYGRNGDPKTYFRFYAVRLSGKVPGGTSYGIAAGRAGATVSNAGVARSAGIVAPTPQGESIGGFEIPVSTLVSYVHTLTVSGPAAPIYVYRSDLGTSGYYLLDAFAGPGNYVDAGTLSVDFTKPLPRGDALALPTGRPMASVNGRLFVGAGNRLYYSEAGNPFSFATNVLFDGQGQAAPDSAGSFSKPGETFNAIVAVGRVATSGDTQGTPLSGAVAVYPVTDRKTYVLSGFDALSLNKTTPICVGTRSPFSVGVASGAFYMLDSERQVRKVQGAESVALSKRVVDDLTLAIPDSLLGQAWGCYHDGRYRLAYAEPGGTQNTRALVLNESMGFESVDRPSSPITALLPYYDASLSRVRILGFGSTSVAETEVFGAETDPGAAPISARIVFPEITGATRDSGTLGLTWGAAWFVSDVDPTGNLSVSVFGSAGKRVGTVPYPAVSLDERDAGATRLFATTGTGKGGDSGTAQVTATFAAKGGKRLYRFEMDAYASGEMAQR